MACGVTPGKTMKVRLLLFMTFLALASHCQWIGETFLTSRPPCDYYLPDHFVGWAAITYAVPKAAPLPIVAGRYQIRFPANGRVSTSTRFKEGSARDRYFYYSSKGVVRELRETGWGGGGMIWAGSIGSSSERPREQVIEGFFVGTEQQFKSDEDDERPE